MRRHVPRQRRRRRRCGLTLLACPPIFAPRPSVFTQGSDGQTSQPRGICPAPMLDVAAHLAPPRVVQNSTPRRARRRSRHRVFVSSSESPRHGQMSTRRLFKKKTKKSRGHPRLPWKKRGGKKKNNNGVRGTQPRVVTPSTPFADDSRASLRSSVRRRVHSRIRTPARRADLYAPRVVQRPVA